MTRPGPSTANLGIRLPSDISPQDQYMASMQGVGQRRSWEGVAGAFSQVWGGRKSNSARTGNVHIYTYIYICIGITT